MVKKKVKKPIVKKKAVKKTKVLPKVMSKLISIALADIRKAEKAKDKYLIDMGAWHVPTEIVCTIGDEIVSKAPACIVCAAGSVMAFTLNMPLDEHIEPYSTEVYKNRLQLLAINYLRVGEIETAMNTLGLVIPKGLGLWHAIPEYEIKNPEPFHKAMAKLQKHLEKHGL